MKILWFTNTPALGEGYLSEKSVIVGGWIKSIDREMQKKVDLHIAFYHKKNILPFKYGNTHYYPIYKGKDSLFRKYIDDKFSRIVLREDVEKYLNIISTVKPDIIHIHGTENPFGYIIERTDIPVVIAIQGNITVYYHKYIVGFDKKYINVSKGILHKLVGYMPFKNSYKKFHRMKYREMEILSQTKYIIGRTAWDRRITSILSPQSSYYHNDEILRDEFFYNKWEYKYKVKAKFIIHTTSGHSFYKGFETICQTVYLLKKSGFDNFEWRVAGISVNDLILKVVKKKLKRKYLSLNLVLLGRLNENELINKLLEADLYVMPSHIENSPNNLCEAMILGMPCIATYVGGTSSLLKNGKEGILIQDGDPWAMAGAIVECFKNPLKSVEYGQNARLRAHKRHDKKFISDELLSIYQRILRMKIKH